MPGKTRTRPRSVQQRPDKTNVALPPLNQPYAGCCKPYPDARFERQELVEINAHHNGPHCKGYMESMSLEEWHAEVARRPRPPQPDRDDHAREDHADRGRRARKRSRSDDRRDRWGDE